VHISSIVLRVEDMDRSIAFWSDAVGLTVIPQAGGFVALDGGRISLLLAPNGGPVTDESLTEVVFEDMNVRQTYQAMAERGVPFETELRPVASARGKELMAAHFRDPDGHYGSVTGWVAE
jgi:catechol 2,3-dioxygenase-like lactoylglutathione lyase family enzyme